MNDGAIINIISTLSNIGGIYLRNSIIFNNALFTYDCVNGEMEQIMY